MARFEAVANLNVRPTPGTEFDPLDTLKKGDVVDEVPTRDWCPIAMEDGTIGWVARKYLRVAPPEAEVPPTAPVTPGLEPVWIRWARQHLGQKEVPGPGDNPVIAAWYHLTTLDKSMWHDATAWCAVFINAALMLNNIKTIRSARAVDWMEWGETADTPQKGDVVVFEWADGSHHVAFYLADAGNGRIQVIGGNQGDAVTITTFPKTSVMEGGYRRAA
jgi:uncharacterized protein (TIGR02594 family)